MPTTQSEAAVCLEFLPNPAGEDEGLGHAGIATYRDDPIAAIARETGQNSRDAHAALPVRISFDVLEIPRDNIPAIDELQAIVESCLSQATGQEKETAFFEQALAVVRNKTLRVLRIADFNTTGARGPSSKGTPFHSLVKASGVSVKDHVDSGGSFGIGKNAVFAASDLQTVFYSTVFEAGGGHSFLAQGKVILVSHTSLDNRPKRQTGYWGLPDFQPINDLKDVPDWLKRTDIGTSIYVVGFRETPNWQQRIAFSLMQNFFPAIHSEEMRFSIDEGKVEIGKAGLASLFEDSEIHQTAISNNQEMAFELSRNLYHCLVSPEAKEKIVDLPELGQVRIRILVADGLPKKVIIIRNGMVITDSLEHFGDKFVRFPMYREFVAIATPLDTKGSAFIKKLEDPKHHELSPEWLPDSAKRTQAKTAMKRLAKEIRDAIKDHALTQFEGEISADEMRRFFSSESDPSAAQSGALTDDPETIKYEVEPKRKKKSPKATIDGTGSTGGGVNGGVPGPGPGPGPHPGPPNPNPRPGPEIHVGSGEVRAIPLNDVRNIQTGAGSKKARRIFFTPDDGGAAIISIQATGLNNSEGLAIQSTNKFLVEAGRIKGELIAGERVFMDIELEDDYEGPIDIQVFFAVDQNVSAANEN